jgi:hypothetical protein
VSSAQKTLELTRQCRDPAAPAFLVALLWAGLFVIGIVLHDLVARFLPLSMRDVIPWGRTADVVAVVSIGASVAHWRYYSPPQL